MTSEKKNFTYSRNKSQRLAMSEQGREKWVWAGNSCPGSREQEPSGRQGKWDGQSGMESLDNKWQRRESGHRVGVGR